MYPVLFRIGHFTVSTYGVLVALASLAATWVASRAFRERGLPGDEAWSLTAYALLGGIVGAKLYYVALHGDLSALLSRGALVWYGGLIGGAAAVLWAVRRKGLPLDPTADSLALALPLGHAIGHIGCSFSGDSYGTPSSVPWAAPRSGGPGIPGASAGGRRWRRPAGCADSWRRASGRSWLRRWWPTPVTGTLGHLAMLAAFWASLGGAAIGIGAGVTRRETPGR